jgi:transposase InsO family protein
MVELYMVERSHGTIRQRNKVMRRLDDMITAQTMMDGLRIYYNFIRPHTALNGRTPAQKANVESDETKWMVLIKKASQHQRFETSS